MSRSNLHFADVLSIRHSVRSLTEKSVTLYEPGAKIWSSIEELSNALNWTHLTSQSGDEYFQSNGVSQKFTNEIIEGATRVNYAQVSDCLCLFSKVPSLNYSATQSIDSIHGLEAVCSLAANGGSSIIGGNWQIFEQFVERSGAQLFLKTEVEHLFCFSPRESLEY